MEEEKKVFFKQNVYLVKWLLSGTLSWQANFNVF